MRRRARGLTRKGEAILTMTVQARPAGPDIFLQGANGAAPQSLAFRLAEPGEQRALAHYLRALKFDRIEIADPARVPLNLADLLTGSGRQVDLYVADAGLICPRGTLRQLDGSVCSTMNQSAPCASCAATLPDGASGAHWRAHWRSLALRANRILVPCASAKGFASGLLDRKLTSVRPHGRPRPGKRLFRRTSREICCGIVTTGAALHELDLIRALARAFKHAQPGVSLVVIGATLDDLGLMACGNVFVSGAIEEGGYAPAFRRYGVDMLFLATRGALFGHSGLVAAQASNLPLAYFDWSLGRARPRAHDLPIDPALCNEDVAMALGRWMARSREKRGR